MGKQNKVNIKESLLSSIEITDNLTNNQKFN